jgi:hypothetical protein
MATETREALVRKMIWLMVAGMVLMIAWLLAGIIEHHPLRSGKSNADIAIGVLGAVLMISYLRTLGRLKKAASAPAASDS